MIVVTGADGRLGRDVVEASLARRPVGEIAASVRDPAAALDLAKRGVQVRGGDFGVPGTLASAFAGAAQVLVVSPDQLGEEARALSRNAIRAGRVLYTSHMGARPGSPFADHAAVEEYLAGTGCAARPCAMASTRKACSTSSAKALAWARSGRRRTDR